MRTEVRVLLAERYGDLVQAIGMTLTTAPMPTPMPVLVMVTAVEMEDDAPYQITVTGTGDCRAVCDRVSEIVRGELESAHGDV